jgi:hypothetical protein
VKKEKSSGGVNGKEERASKGSEVMWKMGMGVAEIEGGKEGDYVLGKRQR